MCQMWTYAVSAAYLLIGLMVKKTAGSYEHFVQPSDFLFGVWPHNFYMPTRPIRQRHGPKERLKVYKMWPAQIKEEFVYRGLLTKSKWPTPLILRVLGIRTVHSAPYEPNAYFVTTRQRPWSVEYQCRN